MTEFYKEYVAGFLFNKSKSRVALVKKLKPEWQAGRYNAIGGKIKEEDMSTQSAMEREFLEETGLQIDADKWRCFCMYGGTDYKVFFFCAFVNDEILSKVRTVEEEKIEVHNIIFIKDLPKISNLDWLIPLALDSNEPQAMVAETL